MRYVFLYLVILLIIGYLIKIKNKEEYTIFECAFLTNILICALCIGVWIIYLFIKYW